MGLRLRINLLITVLMVVFAVAVGRGVVLGARSSIHEEIEAGTRVTVQMLSSVAMLAEVSGRPRAMLLGYLQQLGRVRANDILLFDATGAAPIYRSPPSTYKAGRNAPAWYAELVAPRIAPTTIRLRGARLEVVPEPSRATLDAWDDLMHLLLLGGVFFVAINVLVFWSVSRWLRPLADIQRALTAMERGRLDVTLPKLRLPELRRVGDAFNRMTRALAEATSDNRRLALAVRQSSDAIVIHDPAGRISFMNPAGERLLGYATGALLGRTLVTLAARSRRDDVGRELAAIARREAIDELVTRFVTSEGDEIDVSLAAAPVVDPETDEVLGGIVSCRNLSAQFRAQAIESELKRNRELANVVAAERSAIAQELHDELGQCVTAIRSIAEVIGQRSAATAPDIHAAAQNIKEIAGRIYDDVHAIVRRLRPIRLDALGLAEAVRETVAAWRARNPGTEYALSIAGDLGDVSEALAVTIYRLVQEGLTNIVRHANARHAWIGLSREGGVLRLSIRDDGHGNLARASDHGYGLSGMRERLAAFGGTLVVDAKPGVGTEIRAVVPATIQRTAKVEPEGQAARKREAGRVAK
jgi:hypothetical protein